MHRVARLVLAAALLFASVTFAPSTQASGGCSDIFTTYYDCCMNEVGFRWVMCTGSFGSSGTLSGVFKEVETDPACCGGVPTVKWYQWNGSSWVLLAGPPSAGCHC